MNQLGDKWGGFYFYFYFLQISVNLKNVIGNIIHSIGCESPGEE